jgi:2-polyprenyl-3-methyl-5-hydroxy-6-metoxy-1,4-benzoquinol methylase
MMPKRHWPELYVGPWIVTGNVAKVKVLHELQRLIVNRLATSILDIGIVGPQPLEFWQALLDSYPTRFHLTGVDVCGIDRARQVVEQRGWEQHVTLSQGSGYALHELFAPESFDLVVATQVLEHVARLPLFLGQVVGVMRRGAEGFFTIDSAHYRSRFDIRFPAHLAKNLLKKGLSLFGNERHYDLPWMDHEVISICEHAGLQIIECRYYNLDPIKLIHNHIISNDRKNTFMKLWFSLEEIINDDETISRQLKRLFMALYLHVVKL